MQVLERRGCVYMIFVARNLVEKLKQSNDSLFALFVDLKKAYNSVPRCALWRVLEKCGVRQTMLYVIRSFHEGKHAVVRTGTSTTDSIEVRNGLRKGCTRALTLFNIYFSTMVANWRAGCSQAGVNVRFNYGRKLVGDRITKSQLDEVCLTESQHADDAAVYATSLDTFELTTRGFVRSASKWGLTVSIGKTKGLVVGTISGGE